MKRRKRSGLVKILAGMALFTSITFATKTASAPQSPLPDEEKYFAPSGVIVIDPGHDEHYTGQHYKGLKEEELSLTMAYKLAETLREANYQVYLTRHDEFGANKDSIDFDGKNGLQLNDELLARANIAKELDADYFISLHFNAWKSSSRVKGMEVLLAGVRKEREWKDGKQNHRKIENCRNVDSASYAFGRDLVSYLEKEHGAIRFVGSDLGVLRDNPAKHEVLIEFGYLTNPSERAMATSEYGQNYYATLLAGYFVEKDKEKINNQLLLNKTSTDSKQVPE